MKIISSVRPYGDWAHPDRLLRVRPQDRPHDRFPWAPDLEGLAAAAESILTQAVPRDEVAGILSAYNESQGFHAGARLAERLTDPRSVVIIAGQQPGLFGGPLMMFAKAIATTLIARRLEALRGSPVIPIFWNHSEDHDLAEVNRFSLHEGESVATRQAPYEDAGRCLDDLVVTPEVVTFAETVLVDLRQEDGRALLPVAGERHPLWANRVLAHVLGDLAPVFAEPFIFRSLLPEFLARTLSDADRLLEALRGGSARAQELGFPVQVTAQDAGLLFMQDRNGRRVRLRRKQAWSWAGIEGLPQEDAHEHLLRLSREDPGRFSCTVAVRPCAQQAVLPVAAHINGPAENAYFAQLPELFEELGLPLPAVVPRPSLTVLRQKDVAAAAQLGLDAETLLDPVENWPAQEAASADGTLAEAFAAQRHHLAAAVDAVRSLTDDPGIERAVEGFKKRIEDAAERIEATVRRDHDRRLSTGRASRHRLAEWVHPRGRPQERILGPLALLPGRDPALARRFLMTVDPFDHGHHVVTLGPEDLAPEIVP